MFYKLVIDNNLNNDFSVCVEGLAKTSRNKYDSRPTFSEQLLLLAASRLNIASLTVSVRHGQHLVQSLLCCYDEEDKLERRKERKKMKE